VVVSEDFVAALLLDLVMAHVDAVASSIVGSAKAHTISPSLVDPLNVALRECS